MTTSLTVRQNGTFAVNLRNPTSPANVSPGSPIYGRPVFPTAYGESKKNMSSRWTVSPIVQKSMIARNPTTNKGPVKESNKPPTPKPPKIGTQISKAKDIQTNFTTQEQITPKKVARNENISNPFSPRKPSSSVNIENGIQNSPAEVGKTAIVNIKTDVSNASISNTSSTPLKESLPAWYSPKVPSSALTNESANCTPIAVKEPTRPYTRPNSKMVSRNTKSVLPPGSDVSTKSFPNAKLSPSPKTDSADKPKAKFYRRKALLLTPVVTVDSPSAETAPKPEVLAASPKPVITNAFSVDNNVSTTLKENNVKVTIPTLPQKQILTSTTPSSETPGFRKTLSETKVTTDSHSAPLLRSDSSYAKHGPLGPTTAPVASPLTPSVKNSESESPNTKRPANTSFRQRPGSPVVAVKKTGVCTNTTSPPKETVTPPMSSDSASPVTVAKKPRKARTFFDRLNLSMDQETDDDDKNDKNELGKQKVSIDLNNNSIVHNKHEGIINNSNSNNKNNNSNNKNSNNSNNNTNNNNNNSSSDKNNSSNSNSNSNNSTNNNTNNSNNNGSKTQKEASLNKSALQSTRHDIQSKSPNESCILQSPTQVEAGRSLENQENINKNIFNLKHKNQINSDEIGKLDINLTTSHRTNTWRKNEPIHLDVNVSDSSRSPVLQRSRCLGNFNKTNFQHDIGKKNVQVDAVDVVLNGPTTTNRWTRNQPINFEVKLGRGGGITGGTKSAKETAAQRRLRENRGVRASNNPFKTQDASSPSTASAPAPQADAASSNIDKLLKWIQKRVNTYPSVHVANFTSSWEDGKALCALLNVLLGDEKISQDQVSPDDKNHNKNLAIKVATENGAPQLIEPNELGLDRRSMITYLHMVYTRLYVEKRQAEKAAQAGRGSVTE